MRVTVKGELTSHADRQAVEDSEVLLGEMTLGEVHLLVTADVLSLRHGKHVVQLGDQFLNSGDELDESLRDDDGTEVITLSGTCGNSIGDIGNDIVQALLLSLHLLADETDVWLCLQSTLQGDMRGRASHHLDEVPVLTC